MVPLFINLICFHHSQVPIYYPECIVTSFVPPTDQIYFCSSSDGSVLSVDALTGKGASLDVYVCDLHAILGVSVSEPHIVL